VSDNPRHKNAGQPPVSTHPAFPVIVALWFAALLGIGSMVLPIDLFERFSVASGLADVFQAARPPLGATARIIVALVAAAIGALAGIAIARRIAAANAPKAATRRAAVLDPASEPAAGEPAKRPIWAHEELGEGGFDAGAALAADRETLDLTAFDLHTADMADGFETAQQPAPVTASGDAGSSVRRKDPEQVEAGAPTQAEPAGPLGERALSGLGVVELVERFALALQHHRDRTGQLAADDTAEVGQPTSEFAPDAADGERLAESAAPFAPSADHETRPTPIETGLRPTEFGFEDGDEESADLAHEDEYPSLLAMSPFGLSRGPVRIDHDGDEAGDEPVVIFPGQAGRRSGPSFDGGFAGSSAGAADVRPFDSPLARAEQAAAAASFNTSPARTPADSGATERALRDALEKLQKMSGAA